jgi:hypothetical protein
LPDLKFALQLLGYKTMFKNGKTALIVAVTLSVLGATSAAYAGGGKDRWEGKIGPLGQCFVPPNCGQELQGYQSGPYGLAYIPANPYRRHRDWHRAR